MTQNIYDNQGFFSRYSQLPRSVEGLAGAPEWLALMALPPNLVGLRVLDLGCGFGWFSRWASGQGAAHVLGLDLSENMLAQARSNTADDAIQYAAVNLEHLCLPQAAFDIAYSSLVLHYIQDLAGLLTVLHETLTPGGADDRLAGAPDLYGADASAVVGRCRRSQDLAA